MDVDDDEVVVILLMLFAGLAVSERPTVRDGEVELFVALDGEEVADLFLVEENLLKKSGRALVPAFFAPAAGVLALPPVVTPLPLPPVVLASLLLSVDAFFEVAVDDCEAVDCDDEWRLRVLLWVLPLVLLLVLAPPKAPAETDERLRPGDASSGSNPLIFPVLDVCLRINSNFLDSS